MTNPTMNINGIDVVMTDDQASEFAASQAAATAYDTAAKLKSQALSFLNQSDKTILRCYENSVAVPSAWSTYRAALRTIISSGTGTIPTPPTYPAGT